MLGWSASPGTGADQAFQEGNQTGFEGALGDASGAFGMASDAFLRLMGISDQQMATGRTLGREVSQISRGFLRESTPLRRGITAAAEMKLGIPLLADLPQGRDAKGNLTPDALKQLKVRRYASDVAFFGPQAPERAALESQFSNARTAAIESSPSRGGQLSQTLAQLPEERARAISGMEADATNRALAVGSEIGFGTRGLALQGLEAGAGIQMGGLNSAAASMGGAGAGFSSVGSGYTGIANSFGNMFNAGEDRSSALLLSQLQLQAQQEQAAQGAQGAKKGGTGAGVGAGAGAIIGAVVIA
jgi:hypothetical protein